jgi:LAS superfamily LD-carboxypeptidase LdcB
MIEIRVQNPTPEEVEALRDMFQAMSEDEFNECPAIDEIKANQANLHQNILRVEKNALGYDAVYETVKKMLNDKKKPKK